MKQFLLKEPPDKDGTIRLRDEDYHYLITVRRLKPGSIFTALLPATNSKEAQLPLTVTVRSIENNTLVGMCSEASGETSGIGSVRQELPDIVLFQALPKGARMDLIVRQAAEAELCEVVPFESEHSVPKNKNRDGKPERWRRIIKEARQQSGSAVNTRIERILSIEELFAYWEKLRAATDDEALGLVFNPSGLTGKEDTLLLEKGGFHRYLYKKPPLVVMAVGPEGGLSGAELDRFIKAGFKPLNLGSSVLRTETAALYGAAAVKIILAERTEWTLKQQ